MTSWKTDRELGSVVVEAAFTLLILFVFLLGIMEAGRFFQVQQFLTDAAHEGARVAVKSVTGNNYTSYATKETIYDAINEFLDTGAIHVNANDVVVDCVNLTNGANISAGAPCSFGCPDVNTPCGTRVTVSMRYQVMTLAMFSNLQFDLKGKALMRNETPY